MSNFTKIIGIALDNVTKLIGINPQNMEKVFGVAPAGDGGDGGGDEGAGLEESGSGTLVGNASLSSGVLSLDGNGDYYTGAEGTIDITSDWSFETWFKADAVDDGAIFGIHNGDGNDNQNEMSIGFGNTDEIEVCHDACGLNDRYLSSEQNLATGQWYHLAVTHDDSDNEIDVYLNNKRIDASCIAVSKSYSPNQVLKMPVVKVGTAKCSTAPKSESVSIATSAIPAKIAGLIKGS